MILYHGTTYNRFKSILLKRQIDVTDDSNTHNSNTEYASTKKGYVYLTDNPLSALEFGSSCWSDDYHSSGSRFLTVIKAEVNDIIIENDEDEKKYNSSTIKQTKCFRIKQPLSINAFVDIAYFQFASSDSTFDYIESKKYEAIKWSKVDEKIWNGDLNLM